MIHKIRCLLFPGYRKRQERIALLVLDGWEPKAIYQGEGYYRKILVKGDEYLHPRYTYAQRIGGIDDPVFDATWDAISNDDLTHFMIVTRWAKEKS